MRSRLAWLIATAIASGCGAGSDELFDGSGAADGAPSASPDAGARAGDSVQMSPRDAPASPDGAPDRAPGGEPEAGVPLPDAPPGSLQFSPCGELGGPQRIMLHTPFGDGTIPLLTLLPSLQLFRPDGSPLRSIGLEPGTVIGSLWSTGDGKPLVTREGPLYRVRDASSGRVLHEIAATDVWAVAPDGEIFAPSTEPDLARGPRRLADRSLVWQEPRPEIRLPAAFSSDGKVLATGANDGTVRLWDARTGQLLSRSVLPAQVERPRPWSPFVTLDGGVVVTQVQARGNDLDVVVFRSRDSMLWMIPMQSFLTVDPAADRASVEAEISRDGRRLLIVGRGRFDGRAVVELGIDSGQKLPPSIGVQRATFSHDGRLLTWDSDDAVRARTSADSAGQVLIEPRARAGGGIVPFPSGTRAMIGSDVWDVATSKRVQTLEVDALHGAISSVAVAPRAQQATIGTALARSNAGDVLVYDLESDRVVTARRLEGRVGSVTYSPDGSLVTVTFEEQMPGGLSGAAWRLTVLALPELTERWRVDGLAGGGTFSPDGQSLLTVTESAVRFHAVTNGQITRELPVSCAPVPGMGARCGFLLRPQFAFDGRMLVLPNSNRVLLMDVATGAIARSLPSMLMLDVSVSQDGRLLAIGGRGATVIHSLPDGSEVAAVPNIDRLGMAGGQPIGFLSGRRLAIGDIAGFVRLFCY